MKKLAAAGIVAAVLYGLISFLTSAAPGDIALAPGEQWAACPANHRVRGAYHPLDQTRIRLICQTPSVPTVATAVPTTAIPPTLSPTPSPTLTSIPSSHPNCQNTVPLGAIAPARPIWCFTPLGPEITTHVNGANSWVDDWQHGVSNARLGTGTDGYLTGVLGDRCEALHFRHLNHWMSDTRSDSAQYPTLCSTWLRPARSFSGDRLEIEMEVAVPIAGTREVDGLSDSWPELVISKASAPIRMRNNGTYVYETFPGAWTFGCRMQQNRQPLCALYNTGQSFAGSADRVWEINQTGGQVRFQTGGGAYSSPQHATVWKQCTSTDDPDTVCRNVFRFVFEKDASNQYVFTIYVNGFSYYQAGLLPGMENVLAGDYYVFNGSFAYRLGGDFGTPIIRFHWDRLSIFGE